METISIGLKERYKKGIPGQKIQCVCQINESEYLFCTKTNVFNISKYKSSKSFNYCFKCCIYIKELNVICALSASVPNVVFLSMRSGYPIFCEAYRLQNSLYNTIIYTHKTGKLIIAGNTIEIFELIHERKLFEIDPVITLKPKLSVSCQKMVSKVYFDEKRQLLFAPTKCGYMTIDVNNNIFVKQDEISDLPFLTVATYNTENIAKQNTSKVFKKLLTTDSYGDLILWSNSNKPIRKYPCLNEPVSLCEFINNEYVLFITISNRAILFDIKTGKSLHLASFETKILSMNIISPKFVALKTEYFYVEYQINIPFEFFSRMVTHPTKIQRIPSFFASARVGICLSDGIFSLYSPDIKMLLLEVGTTSSLKIKDFVYDRKSSLRIGNNILQNTTDIYKSTCTLRTITSETQMNTSNHKYRNERIFFLYENGKVYLFDSIYDHFVLNSEFKSIAMKEFAMTYLFGLSKQPIFVGTSQSGELITLDYDALDVLSRSSFRKYPPQSSHIHHKSNSIYFIYDFEIIKISLLTKEIIEIENVQVKPKMVSIEDDLMIIVYENQTIILRNLDNKSEERIKLLEVVTYLTVQYNTFIIVTDHQTIRIGHSFENYAVIEMPFTVFTVGFLNPDLDILIGLDFETMKVKRNQWYPYIDKLVDCPMDDSNIKNETVISHIRMSKSTIIPKDSLLYSNNHPQKLTSSSVLRSNNSPQMKRMRHRFQQIKIKAAETQKRVLPVLPPFLHVMEEEKCQDIEQNDDKLKDIQFLRLFGDIEKSINDQGNQIDKENQDKSKNDIKIISSGLNEKDHIDKPKHRKRKKIKRKSSQVIQNNDNQTEICNSNDNISNIICNNQSGSLECDNRMSLGNSKGNNKEYSLDNGCKLTVENECVSITDDKFNPITSNETKSILCDETKSILCDETKSILCDEPKTLCDETKSILCDEPKTLCDKTKILCDEPKTLCDEVHIESKVNNSFNEELTVPHCDTTDINLSKKITCDINIPDISLDNLINSEEITSVMQNNKDFSLNRLNQRDNDWEQMYDVVPPFESPTTTNVRFKNYNSNNINMDAQSENQLVNNWNKNEINREINYICEQNLPDLIPNIVINQNLDIANLENNQITKENIFSNIDNQQFMIRNTKICRIKKTLSSPDLILLQSKLGNAKIFIKRNNEFKKGEFPSISINLIEKVMKRTRSEYKLVKTIDQNETNKTTRPIAPINIDRETKINFNQAQRRRSLVPRRREDNHPIGNVELAIKIFRPLEKKK
ncbi:hypothetical protein TRFO_19199 [Tritrichomonas foetus]|uniref:Uncharacterized protein n=1 Tax=Tritrichomonas foetus TaxID=1144522 RepID=A0A1J4KNW0_9EUKA|nr:hypothetical protein TRFO_19199 [Tritrichomonas foetus]|eukprot:OHT11390.1 hypothetical protein TRFO_19199 [Tritrichomonas foetus]